MSRPDFGRVDAIVALRDLLSVAPDLDGVQVVDAWPGDSARDECVYFGDISGEITLGPFFASQRTAHDDQFVIPVHITATRTAPQAESLDARRRVEALQSAVLVTIASEKKLDEVPGVTYATVIGADNPMPQQVEDPVGWVAYATVRVQVRIRMQ